MRKWMRRSLFSVGGIVVIALALSVVVLAMFRASPEWYGADAASPVERERLAHAAENKLIRAQNWAQELRADEVRLARANERGATIPATRAADSMILSLSQHEMNALFDKWSVIYGWKQKYARYLEDPQVILRQGRLIVAGKMKELGSIVSFQFQPHIDASGHLRLDLLKVTGGKLPLPASFWTPWRDRMTAKTIEELPRWRRQARIEPTGAANVWAMAATMGTLLLDIARQQPGEPVLFLPLAEKSDSVPVRVIDVAISDGELLLHVRPLTPAQRTELLHRIHNGD